MSETTSEDNRMPKVDFEKEKVPEYVKDQAKVVERENLKRLQLWRYRLHGGRKSFTLLSALVIGIYSYTMYAVGQETFLDNFDEPVMDDEIMTAHRGISGNVLRLPPLPTIRELLQLYNLRALKQLSQNFLLNERLNNKIVKCCGKLKGVEVCEVGPGAGNLTRSIIMKGAEKIYLIEKDTRFIPCLQMLQEAALCPVEMIIGDVMRLDMETLFSESKRKTWDDDYPTIQIIGNLPFQLSTALIIKYMKAISEKKSAWSYGRVRMTFTFQKEVGERIEAPVMSAQRCRLSIMCQNWCDVQNKFIIPGSAFTPKPEVDVSVVHFKPRIKPVINLPFDLVEKVVTAIFRYRQRYVLKGLQTLFPPGPNEKLVQHMLEESDIDSKLRSFQLSVEEIGRLCHGYKNIIDRSPNLHNYTFSSRTDIDWTNREHSSEEAADRWKIRHADDEEFY